MTISIRLEERTEEALRQQIKAQNATLSAYVRDAILEKIARDQQQRPNPYELGKHVFGRFSSDRTDRSINRKAILKEKLREKHHC